MATAAASITIIIGTAAAIAISGITIATRLGRY
jgi:hypothetical protein